MKKNDNITEKSRRLSFLLRHDQSYPLEVGGWRSVNNLIDKESFTFDELCNLVAIHDIYPQMDCLYGCSYNKNIDEDEIRISAFIQ